MDTSKKNNIIHNATLEQPHQSLKPSTIIQSPCTVKSVAIAHNQLTSVPPSPANHQPHSMLKNNTMVNTNMASSHPEPSIQSQSQMQPQKFVPTGGVINPHTQVKTRKETLEAKRERKAAKTLAIITGAFVVCWLPFFLMALILPLCGETCSINDKIAALFLWLGYFNSTLNPVIYTIFSPEFRQAFKRILFGTHRTGYYRGGKL